MRRTSLSWTRAARSARVAGVALFGCAVGVAASTALAQTQTPSDTIYSCAGSDGKEVLQNMPCGTGAQVWAQKDAASAAPGKPAAVSAPAPTVQPPESQDAQPANDPTAPHMPTAVSGDADADADKDKDGSELANLPGEPAVGMTQAQVRAILGEPTSVQQEEVVNGRLVTWNYGDSRSVQFDVTGKVISK